MNSHLRFSSELLFGMDLVYEEMQYANIMNIIYRWYARHVVCSAVDFSNKTGQKQMRHGGILKPARR